MISKTIFRDYDVRAIVPDELDYEGLERLTKAFWHIFKPKTVAIGYDARTTGPDFVKIMTKVFLSAGVEVTHLGMISTDMMTFASGQYGYDLAIEVTASHNPANYNGFKMATKGGLSVNGESGFYPARDLALSDDPLEMPQKEGKLVKKDIYEDWINFCLSFVDLEKIKPLKVVFDVGNGVAGKIIGHPLLAQKTGLEVVPLFFEPDGSFPNHIPNPLKPENQEWIVKKTPEVGADFGVMLDGDGDRIAFFDEKGRFVNGTLVTALVAEIMLAKKPGSTVLYNAVCGRTVPETIEKMGGKHERTRVGYSLIKARMAETKAIFAGEHSCHFFYRDVFYSEASLLTYLLVAELFSQSAKTFSEFIAPYDKYEESGEINFEVEDKQGVMEKLAGKYEPTAKSIDWLDGVSIWFDDYWINIRPSNTQPLLRLNLEADNKQILDEKTAEVISAIESLGAKKSAD